MAWTSAWKFCGALPGNGRWSSGTQTYIFIHKTCYFFPAFGFAAMPGKCPGCVSPMKAQMWDRVAGYLQQRCVQGRKLLVLVTVPFLHQAMHVGPQPIPCSLPATTQLKLITYQEYQHSHKACAGWRRRLSLSPFFSFPPSLASSLAEPQDLEGGSRGGLGRAATSRAYPRPHFDLQYCLLISTSQMLLSSATERQIPEGEGSVVGREEMKAEKSRIY